MYTPSVIETLPQVHKFAEEQKIHPNDIVFLGSTKTFMLYVDFALRQTGQQTTTMFTSLEEYQYLSENFPNELDIRDREIERARKVGFWMNTGCIKVSTIQSFKGWKPIQ